MQKPLLQTVLDSIRFLGSNGGTSGRLQMAIRNQWMGICWMSDNTAAADVVCKQLGLYGGTFIPNTKINGEIKDKKYSKK